MEAEGRVGWDGGAREAESREMGAGDTAGCPHHHGNTEPSEQRGQQAGGVGQGPQLRSKRQRCRRERVNGPGGVGGRR